MVEEPGLIPVPGGRTPAVITGTRPEKEGNHMNKSRRTRIDKLIERIDDLMSDLDLIREEEQEAYDNLPESIQDSERGESMYDAIDNLESAYSSLEEVEDYLNEAKGE